MTSSPEPSWLTLEDVLAYHQESINQFGGSHGIRDKNLLESALSRPKNKWMYEEPTLQQLAAAYAYGISSNHPFVDGNKRTAFLACRVFLLSNQIEFNPKPEEAVIAFLDLAAGKISEESLANWITDNTTSL